ncbi:MAG: DNA polymerase I, partial [Alphaproteobacteria bacterium]
TGIYLNDFICKLQDILCDRSILKVFYDFKKFLHIFPNIEVSPVSDVLLMSYSLKGTSVNPELDNIITSYLGINLKSITDFTGTGKNKLALNQLNIQDLANYSSSRAESILKIHKILKQDLFKAKSLTIYETLERPLSRILYDMEIAGIRIDQNRLKLMSNEFEKRLQILEKEIFALTGCEFNIGSPKQLSEVLFNQMGLSAGKVSKSGNLSTGADILEILSEQGHAIADLLLEWRSLSKLKNTYTDNLVQLAHPETDRIHTTFSMASTSTGRLSSIDPNLQNIPIRSEEGNKIRSCFIARSGYKLVSADYSQIELRILAHIADIQSLKTAFHENRDIHTATASQIFGISSDDVDPNMRRKAKAINFGIIYGISSFGLAKQLSISRADASNYIKAYFREYPGIEKYMEDTKNFAKSNGYVQTLYGRRCYVRGINDNNAAVRTFSERAAINAPIQGTAADIIKSAMVKLPSILKHENLDATMLLQVHDELLFEVKEDQAQHTALIIKKTMESVIDLTIRLVVEVGVGDDWASIH